MLNILQRFFEFCFLFEVYKGGCIAKFKFKFNIELAFQVQSSEGGFRKLGSAGAVCSVRPCDYMF